MADPKRPFGWNGNEGEFISKKEAVAGTAAFRKSKAGEKDYIKAHYFGGKKLLRLLAEGKAVGVRTYYAKAQVADDNRGVKVGQEDIYLVGVDSAGNDILEDENGNSLIMDRGLPCPHWCSGGGEGLNG